MSHSLFEIEILDNPESCPYQIMGCDWSQSYIPPLTSIYRQVQGEIDISHTWPVLLPVDINLFAKSLSDTILKMS